MEPSARDSYLEAQVLTATPQKLRLMLIEAALRFARMAYDAQLEQNQEQVLEASIRCRSIVTELLASIDPGHSPLTKNVVALYVYLFQTLTEGQLRRDATKFLDAIHVLEIERETWRQVCDKMPFAPAEADVSRKEITAGQTVILPHMDGRTPAAGSFTLDA